MFEITVANFIDSAHFLRGYKGKCSNIHGHTWRVEVTLRGEKLNEIGLLADFNDIKKIIKESTDSFDHKLINDLEPFNEINPSSENIAKYFYQMLSDKLSTMGEGVTIVKVLVSESRDTSAVYYEIH
ncbi:6-carboxytetrahydropterin synthase QueD [Desulfocucumis palustris]|uniref:6-carboxytetrahydropterin synthase QueD n=1 Tax=Desulfocucumis palustris TaxID=1898651 RepID=UPI000CEA5B1F|nr:6-carboxytetrahydropterin synthase QueD [Desulfocucumis palustris]